MDNQRQYTIVYGPNDRHTFIEAFERACHKANDAKDITFTVAYNPQTKEPHQPGAPYAQAYVNITKITGIFYEDSSGQIFGLIGHAKTEERLSPSAPPSYNFKAYYDVSRRKGHITIG